MRITIEATDDVSELTRARECIDAMLAPLASPPAAVETSARIDALALSARTCNALLAGNADDTGTHDGVPTDRSKAAPTYVQIAE